MRRSLLSAALFAAAGFTLCAIQPSTPPGPDSIAELRKLFAAPPAEYSTLPFLVWNGEVTEDEIDKLLADYQAQGIRGFFIHPRPGMITPYLSDRWFELIRYTVDRAKKLGMRAWLYDENSYPSGFAGGHVPAQMPESYNAGQGLILQKVSRIEDAKNHLLVLKRSGGGFEDVTSRVASEAGQTGDYYAFELASYEKSGWYGGFSYVDLLRPGVTEKFIEVTMPGYERALGAELGRTVPGIFTDEPNLNPPRRGSIRWTPDLFEQFRKRWGYDLKLRLPSLFEETGDWRKVRHDYYALLLELFIERWSKPWQHYADERGIFWTGHYWEHGWPSPNDGPDNMAMYAYHNLPGIDMLFNQFRDGVNAQFGNVRAVKELAGVANQLGRRRRLSETYGGAGWELRFEDMKRLGDWEYVLGVNMMNQHLSFETLAGARKYDYPQSFSYHEPWWPHYHVLAGYFARLSLALSAGEQVNRILVLEPTSSAWMYAGAKPNPGMMAVGRTFQAFVTRLEELQTEFDLGCEHILKEHGSVNGARLVAGRRAYDLLVLPPGTENLESASVELIAAYLEAGGKVLAYVDPPRRVDGAESNRLIELASRYASQWRREQAPEALANGEFTAVSGHLLHQRRRLSDGELLFFVNSSLERPASARVAWKYGTASRLDPITGTISPYPVGAGGTVEISLPPAGSLLLVSGGEVAKPEPPLEERALAAGPTVVRRLSPNVLKIDYCDLTLAGTTERGLYFYNAADKVFKHYGFAEGNPWNTAVQYKTNILDRNTFPPDSGFEAAFHFEVDEAVDRSTLQAVVERPWLWKVSVNGKRVANRPGAWWLDRAFGVYSIGTLVVPGRNTITLVARPMSVHHELEPVYILGEFGAAAQDRGFRLVAQAPLTLGAWKEQNLPFYFRTVAYSKEVRTPGRRSGRIKVRLGKWHGTVAEVRVNSKPAGIIGWPPYECDITDWLAPGVNQVEVAVYGSLKNLLGPHHGRINRGLTSPWSFRTAPAQAPPGAAYDLEGYGLLEDFSIIQANR
ncbi:MAG: glycosyl hydrolase [Rhodospirillales bacterium]